MAYWPQITYLALTLFGAGFVLAMHGHPRRPLHAGNHILCSIFVLALLWAGGFFEGMLP